ncbi:MAG: IS3 family transposase [Chitinivibrionales bacterium]|nr:IS3 family transposase [Chitinivibrionales bacterium]MBD3359065.1 IS3 family transposase [Chitinivibrionales bacterium]
MKRRRHSDQLKAKVVIEALRGVDTVNEIAKCHEVHPLMVTKWEKHVVSLLPSLFSRRTDRERDEWKQREAELFQEIGQLKYELDWLKKKAASSASELRQCINRNERRISISRQCALLGMPRSTCYNLPAGEGERNLHLMRLIDEEYTAHPFYGSRQMCLALRLRGWEINRKRVRRLMRLMGLEAIYPKRRLSAPGDGHRIYPYLLRNVAVVRADQVWSTDITYVRLAGGFAFLVAFIDWYSRYVLSHAVSTTLDHQFCLTALREAQVYGRAEIHNSDQGSQFTCASYLKGVQETGMRISMDGKGRALDNVFVERLWRSVKYEDVYLKDYASPREAAIGLAAYFRFYNHERPHQSLRGRTPAQVYAEKKDHRLVAN